MNKVFLIGNLTRDPELSETSSGVSVCKFSLAVARPKFGDAEQVTDFFNCVAWRGLGETIAKYCTKGGKISVMGSVQFRTYEDKAGNQKQATDIIVSDVEFLSSKGQSSTDSDVPKKTSKPAPKQTTLVADDDYDDDMPF